MSARRYIVVETLISVAINIALSVAFALAVFGSRDAVNLSESAVLLDMLPHGFMVAFMGALVPSLLARSRIAKSKLAGQSARVGPLLLRALLFGAVAALAGTGILALFRLDVALALPDFVAAKAAYGGVLAGIATPIALIRTVTNRV